MATIKTQGATLVVDDGAGVDITIGEVTGVSGIGGGSVTEIPITNWASTAQEFRAGLADNGSATIDVNYDVDDAGQDELLAIRVAQESREFKLTFPEGTDKVLTFTAFVTSMPIDAASDEIARGSFTVRLTGALTKAAT